MFDYIMLLLIGVLLIFVCICVCTRTARPEENGVEVTPVERGSDRGRRARGGRGDQMHIETLSVCPTLECMLLTCV